MQGQHVVSGQALSIRAGFAVRLALLAFGTVLSLTLTPCFAVEDQGHEHAMNMDMNMDMDMSHSGHEQTMDHSKHEHQLSRQGAFIRSVADFTVPDVKMVNMNGTEVALRSVLNSHSPIILNFIFTTCTTICPVQSATFRQVQQKLGAKRSTVHMVSISIDPENDTPAKLKEYATKFSVGPQWDLLTGSLENTIAVQKAFSVFAGDKMDQKAVTFLKAKGSDNSWVRLDGLVDAREIVKEFDKLDAQ